MHIYLLYTYICTDYIYNLELITDYAKGFVLIFTANLNYIKSHFNFFEVRVNIILSTLWTSNKT